MVRSAMAERSGVGGQLRYSARRADDRQCQSSVAVAECGNQASRVPVPALGLALAQAGVAHHPPRPGPGRRRRRATPFAALAGQLLAGVGHELLPAGEELLVVVLAPVIVAVVGRVAAADARPLLVDPAAV